MKESFFTSEELSELESLQVRGGASGNTLDPLAQLKCVNKDRGCGTGVIQYNCTNEKDSQCGIPWQPNPDLQTGCLQSGCNLHFECTPQTSCG